MALRICLQSPCLAHKALARLVAALPRYSTFFSPVQGEGEDCEEGCGGFHGLEEIAKDLREHGDWDGVTKVGCLAFRVDRQGKITNDILHLLGVSEPKRLDAKLVFGKDYNHQKMTNIMHVLLFLDTFRLMSDQVPSELSEV